MIKEKYLAFTYLSNNIGDDLMISEVLERNEGVDFYFPALREWNSRAFSKMRNAFPLRPGWKRFARIARMNGLVVIGGSMFMDHKERSVRAWLAHRVHYSKLLFTGLYMRLAGKQFIIVGCNVGPVQTYLGSLMFKAIFALSTSISVRDKASSEFLISKNVGSFFLAPDMVFSYIERHALRARDMSGVETEKLAISIVNLANPITREKYRLEINCVLSELIKNNPRIQLKFFVFQSSEDGDEALTDEIIADLKCARNVEKTVYSGNPKEFIEEIAGCNYLIGSRFHSIVIAIGLGLRFSVLSYSEKIDSMLTDLGWPGTVYHCGTLEKNDCELLANEWKNNQVFKVSVSGASNHASPSRFYDQV